MSRTVHYQGLTFYGGYSVSYMQKTCRNLAGLLFAMGDPYNDGRVVYKGGIVRAAANHGLITDKPRRLTPFGHKWLRDVYVGDYASLAEVSRDRPMPAYTARARIKMEVSKIAAGLIDAGLILIHPTLIANLGPEETYLWLYCKAHEREQLTTESAAAALRWPVEHVRIRAERCAERGYPLSLSKQEDAA